MNLYRLREMFHAASGAAERERVRDLLREAGFGGVADTIGRRDPSVPVKSYEHTVTRFGLLRAALGARLRARCGFVLETDGRVGDGLPWAGPCPDCAGTS
ncbi:hypothetical protein [Saccharothrix deserti]|uniref:hypothetical protein n=1 Tax=Saccharothrix deserti TaxID=2593674 RepID=UPI00131D4BD2|nr:hypothetical protein [Saccharothrix deserti]